MKRFAIVGAGLAGLSCAGSLKLAGRSVTLFDKGRGPGGRMATRRMATPLGNVEFDHGAQYFTVRDPAFKRQLGVWANLGIAAPWPEAGTDAWVGVPRMNALANHIVANHDVAWEHNVTSLVRMNEGWSVRSQETEHGPFDAVILAIPAEQAVSLLSLHDFAMGRVALTARSQPCWTGMFAFAEPLSGLPAIVRNAGDLAWSARNSSKPGRTDPEAWVVQANAAWSQERLEDPPEQVAKFLLEMLALANNGQLPKPIAAIAHRWRFALSAGTGDGALWNPALALGVCGDWLLGPRVECAWLSGQMLADYCIGTARSASLANVAAHAGYLSA